MFFDGGGGQGGGAPFPQGKSFYENLSKVKPSSRTSNATMQFDGNHGPQTSGSSQNQEYDVSKMENGETGYYTERGISDEMFGQKCTPVKQYYNQKQELDGKVPRGKYREIPPKQGEMPLRNIVENAFYRNMQTSFKGNKGVTSDRGNSAKISAEADAFKNAMSMESQGQASGAQEGMTGMAETAANAESDAFDSTWMQMMELSRTPLLNIANENAGTACSASQPLKTYSEAVYLVQQAYRHVYLPIGILLLLPGAVITQVKGLVSAGMLHNTSDDDIASPFTGILRSLIAIFLIPATQVIVSYAIDVGNSTQYEVYRHINYEGINRWADEQVFRPPDENFKGSILPGSMLQSVGKLSEKPEKMAVPLNMNPASIMLQMLANSMAESAAFGLVILCAFQVSMGCYLLLMGPVAAALYAWPGGTGSLFQRVFVNWVDAIINLALWRFWWCVVLLTIDTRLGWLGGDLNIYSIWELMMFIAFLVIMTYVPFNPFDFKAGEMVAQIMAKADEAVQEASQKKG